MDCRIVKHVVRRALVAFLALCVLAPLARAGDKVVNIYNWADYIDPAVLRQFMRETGIRVVYDTFDSNEALEAKLLAGDTGYDVVVPSGTFLQREIEAGLYQKLDKSQLPNWKNLWPAIMAHLAVYDPGNRYAVNYMWSTIGIAYNVAKVKKRLGRRAIDSWKTVFNSAILRRFSDCGVDMLNNPQDLFSVALRYMGRKPNSQRFPDIRKAARLIMHLRPYVKSFASSESINALADGDICLAVTGEGDALQARDRAREAGNGARIDYVIPREGTLISLDNLAIPKDAPHVGQAYRLINFLLRPDIAARNSRMTRFANGVVASIPYLDKNILADKAIYPSEDVLKRLFTVTSYNAALQRYVGREWARIEKQR